MSLAREAATSPTWFELSVRALEAAYSERPLLAAPTLVFDLTALLHGERLLPVPPPGLEPVWRGASWLPTLAEIRDPGEWLDRVRLSDELVG